MPRGALLALATLFTTACELQEVVVAQPEPFVIVEAYLVAGSSLQTVGLHTSAGAPELLHNDASIVLFSARDSISFTRVDTSDCLAAGVTLIPRDFPGGLACYGMQAEMGDRVFVRAGELYRLQVELSDGRWLTGTTRVPDAVRFVAGIGGGAPCYLPPWTQVELTWKRTSGTAAHIIDLRGFGVGEALAREGIEADVPDPVILRGLAIGIEDTTIVLPREFGLFDRFVLDPALVLALQEGLPPGVPFDVTLAAVDHNYVNWVRGGDFNPSGLIRTPSMFGPAGTGVLGSMTLDAFVGTTDTTASDSPRCGPPAS